LQDVLALYDNLRPQVTLSLPTGPLVIQAEPTRLRQVFHNLLQNAIDAQSDTVEPRYDVTLEARGDEVAMTFGDAGTGFGEEVRAHAFEPYVTTKSKGTGLGLAIVKKIIDEHGGRVELANRAPRGAQVTLVFPRSTSSSVG
jgi:nitrogen fixation/metabolism regulation signal transduction histidine kinase